MRPPGRLYPFLSPQPAAPDFALRGLVFTGTDSAARRRGLTTAGASIVIHLVLAAAAVVLPLLFFEDVLPVPELAVRAFFAAPPQVAVPPPPPPPAAAPLRARARAEAPVPPPDPGRFLAPVETPDQLPAEETVDLGVEGGVPGGVEGGVPGGVVGGVIGGLPAEPPPPPRVVRVGGNVRAPKLIHDVKPIYPDLAVQARAQALIVLEAHVGTDGRVHSVQVLRGHPVFDQAAVDAVQQWRYQPLLLNGLPTEFLVTVTLNFRLRAPTAGE